MLTKLQLARPSLLVILAASAVGAFILAAYFGLTIGAPNADLRMHLKPWFSQLESNGLAAISSEYSNYTPPYLYVLWCATALSDVFSTEVLIKLANAPFMLLSSIAIFFILRRFDIASPLCVVAALLFLCIPTVMLNSLWWGQCDIIYTSFLLLFFLWSIEERPWMAMAAYATALSLKLQAAFLSPYLLLLWARGSIRWTHFLLIPVIYCALMLPAALQGRPWSELLTIYFAQTDTFQSLSMNAPNLYLFLDDANYALLIVMGISLAVIVSLLLVLFAMRLSWTPQTKLLIATASTILVPFSLPKMHDRYFFLADVFTFIAAFVIPRAWLLAILVQLGSIFAYTKFLWNVPWGPRVGALFMTGAVIWLAYLLKTAWDDEAPRQTRLSKDPVRAEA